MPLLLPSDLLTQASHVHLHESSHRESLYAGLCGSYKQPQNPSNSKTKVCFLCMQYLPQVQVTLQGSFPLSSDLVIQSYGGTIELQLHFWEHTAFYG